MSYKLQTTSQKAKLLRLSGPNYRTEIRHVSKYCAEHCSCGIIIVELPQVKVFMQLLPFIVFSVIIYFFAPLLGNFWYQMQANSRRKRSPWNYHSKPIVELPLIE